MPRGWNLAQTEAGITPTSLIQSLIIRQFETSTDPAKNRPLAKQRDDAAQASSTANPDCELGHEQRHRQLLYEVGKMRAVLLHSLDHTLSADSVDEIIEASEQEASDYVAELLGSKGGQQ